MFYGGVYDAVSRFMIIRVMMVYVLLFIFIFVFNIKKNLNGNTKKQYQKPLINQPICVTQKRVSSQWRRDPHGPNDSVDNVSKIYLGR